MSDLRIVLLGKSVSENSLVGNFILGRAAFHSEAPPDVVERVAGRLKDRHLIIINSPQLLQRNISDHQITQTVRECAFLSDPGPHVILIILQYKNFTEEDLRRVKIVLKEFSEEAVKHTIVITTDEEKHHARRASVKVNEFIQQLIKECEGRHAQYKSDIKFCCSEIFKRIEKILKKNKINDEYLRCNTLKDAKNIGSSVGREDSGSVDPDLKKMEEQSSVSATRKQKLNLVLCGSDETLKKSISELLKEKREDMELQDHLINLLELPALIRLSEEDVMRQTLSCVSLCHPGVHVFLLVIPDAPLNNEEKAEMEEVQKRFSSRINKHIIILKIKRKNIMQMISKISPFNFLPTEAKTSLQMFGGQHFTLENSSQVPALLQDVENMVKQNNGSYYTTFMYLQAQVELERNKHRAEIEELRRSVMKTAGVTHNDDEDDGGVRIVLMGKTGVGKSATGNTILGKKAFTSIFQSISVTRECQKETSEFNRRRISVIDTPGLFDTGVDNDEIRKEIVKCISMAAPGPHVFLLVIQLGRFTKEEKEAVKMIQETFGDQSRKYTMVLFTRGDDLRGTTIQEFIKGDHSLQNLIHQCGERYHVFNNNETEDQTQVSELLEKIDRMVAKNGGSFYTNEMFQQVEKNIREEQERILKEKEEEIKKKEEELRAKYEAEIEQMKKENEEKKQEMKNELRKKEDLFKTREEEIRKVTDENLKNELKKKLEKQQKRFEEENNRKKKDLEDQQNTMMKLFEERHEKEKEDLKKRIQYETRKQAEDEFSEKLTKALKEYENNLPYTSKLARGCDNVIPILGGAVGGLAGGVCDLFIRIFF